MADPTPAGDGPFRFEYDPAVIRFGEGCVADLGDELAAHGLDRALVVSGRTVGTAEDVIGPVRAGLGDRLGAVFAETTPEKRLATAVAAAERYRDVDADAIVGLGGGSSLDVAKQTAVVLASDRSPAELGAAFAATDTLPVPDDLPPIVAVPTTLAGADLSQGAGLNASPDGGLVDEPTSGGIGGRGLMPTALVADPALYATTPRSVLAASAMNGFDKGLESLYSPRATPITDATASRALALLVDALPTLGDDPVTAADLGPVVRGILLAQFGFSRPGESTLSLLHAFGHALSDAGVHQGTAHGVVAPHVVAFLLDADVVRRDLLADAVGVGDAATPDAAIVDAVADVRDALGLPGRLRSLDAVDRRDLPALADATLADDLSQNVPADLDLDRAALEEILEAAW